MRKPTYSQLANNEIIFKEHSNVDRDMLYCMQTLSLFKYKFSLETSPWCKLSISVIMSFMREYTFCALNLKFTTKIKWMEISTDYRTIQTGLEFIRQLTISIWLKWSNINPWSMPYSMCTVQRSEHLFPLIYFFDDWILIVVFIKCAANYKHFMLSTYQTIGSANFNGSLQTLCQLFQKSLEFRIKRIKAFSIDFIGARILTGWSKISSWWRKTGTCFD